jgi:hypothetical protein
VHFTAVLTPFISGLTTIESQSLRARRFPGGRQGWNCLSGATCRIVAASGILIRFLIGVNLAKPCQFPDVVRMALSRC